MEEILVKSGFEKSKFEPWVYLNFKELYLTIVAIYVDDFLLLSNNDTEKQTLKNILSNEFKIKELGPVRYFLGINIIQNNAYYRNESDRLRFVFIREILFTNANSVSIPLYTKLR